MRMMTIGVVLLLTAPVSAAAASFDRVTELVTLTFTDFVYHDNFWATSFPDTATMGGPSPVSTVELAFEVIYLAPVETAQSVGRFGPVGRKAMVRTTTVDLPSFSAQGSLSMAPVYFDLSTSDSAPRDLGGRGFSFSGGVGTAGANFSFTIPEFFGPGSPVHATGEAKAGFNSPRSFDSPDYISSTVSAERELLSVTAVVPVPASVLSLLGGVAVLASIARRRARPAA